MLVLITYDVNTENAAGKTRLRKVAKQCVNYGRRVQNSVFECLIDNAQSITLKAILADIIDPESEDEDLEKIPQTVLMKFVSELPSGYRTVFNLYTFEEKSHKEIAALLGINEKSSSSQLFRARAMLAKRIKMYLTKASV